MASKVLKIAVNSAVRVLGKSSLGSRLLQRFATAAMENRWYVEHDGVRLSFAVPNYTNWWRARSFASKEPETLGWIDGFEPGAVLWDVGANVGLYSCYAAKRRGCRVFAFEPSVFNLELLARNVWDNDLSDLVTLVPLPLAEGLATSTLNMTTTEWGGAMSTFDKSYTHDGTQLRKTFEFRTVGVSMDDAVKLLGIPQPDYIKMDVDGIEHLILRGGAGVLRNVRGVLIEINERFKEQLDNSTGHLSSAGLALKEKRHADQFEGTIFSDCYNQIWQRRES